MLKRVAILVDGDFFIKRHIAYFKKLKNLSTYQPTPLEMADNLHIHCLKHIKKDKEELYRIFFYDCKPLDKKVHYPLSKKAVDFSKSETFIFRRDFHKALISKPCLALRLGYLDENNASWDIKNEKKRKDFLSGKISVQDLQDDDYFYHAKQKGVDMKIGLDIANLAFKKLVQRIVLISGDSDFVPAAKLARTEGIIFSLDAMGNAIKMDLREHIDYLSTTLPRFKKIRDV